MCVATPMRLVSVSGDEGRAEQGGVTRSVSLALLESAAPGDYVLIHAGFAIAVVDEEEARLSLEAIAECAGFDSPEPPPEGAIPPEDEHGAPRP
jgi:hydrogenase expression/formation protein HypC